MAQTALSVSRARCDSPATASGFCPLRRTSALAAKTGNGMHPRRRLSLSLGRRNARRPQPYIPKKRQRDLAGSAVNRTPLGGNVPLVKAPSRRTHEVRRGAEERAEREELKEAREALFKQRSEER